MKIKIFITGGTFDKEYNELDGTLIFKDTHLPEMLKLGRNHVPIDMQTLMMIDSLDMTDDHRQLITEHIKNIEEQHIIITHGTDTMVQTAQTLASQVQDKTIVLVGAMVPYKFGSSDGLFNLGAALAFVQTLPNGVYIAMNGRYFTPETAKKTPKPADLKLLNNK